jgi:hypothetical protein
MCVEAAAHRQQRQHCLKSTGQLLNGMFVLSPIAWAGAEPPHVLVSASHQTHKHAYSVALSVAEERHAVASIALASQLWFMVLAALIGWSGTLQGLLQRLTLRCRCLLGV